MGAALPAVSRTAVGVARVRAAESARADRLFDDPYAAAFVAALAGAVPDRATSAAARALGARFVAHVAVRTRFYDEYLLGATDAGVRQVVLLAAGLDARAFRLSWPDGVRLFELDLPAVLAAKQRVLDDLPARPAGVRVPVAVDLRGDWPAALAAAGFDAGRPTAWLAEGLLVYLTAEDAAALLGAVGDCSAPGSRLACERGDTAAALTAGGRVSGHDAVALWRGGLGAETGRALAERGWQVSDYDAAAVAAGYGRTSATGPGGGFLLAERVAAEGHHSAST